MKKTTPAKGLKPRKTPAQTRSVEKTVAVILEAALAFSRSTASPDTPPTPSPKRPDQHRLPYQYFPTKDALTVALIDRETAPLP